MDQGDIRPAQRAAGVGADLAALQRMVAPISSRTLISEAADLIRKPEYQSMLCLPVVDDGVPVGLVSRNHFTDIFLLRFGRELYGNRPVSEIMNPKPVTVADSLPLEAAAALVSAGIGTPITEDYVITRNGRYAGMGVVLDLIGAMQTRVAQNSAKLSEAYQQLKSSQAALVQSEKMASLGQMVAGVAHEINTPLGYVRNNVEMMQGLFDQLGEMLGDHERLAQMLTDDGADENTLSQQIFKVTAAAADLHDSRTLEDAKGLFADTLFGVDTIKELVINLRNFTRLDSARVAEVSLNDCLDQTLVIANNLLRGKVEVIKRYGELPLVACSPSQINQVFLNIIGNAAQAVDQEQGKLLLKTERDGAWARISIQDNGRGIPPENLKKIFDPFFTTKPVGQGTGLGLSISYQIVQSHGGSIQVASVVGKGTKFVVSLPLQTAAAPAQAPSIEPDTAQAA
jgi:signal transduction histidine kinase